MILKPARLLLALLAAVALPALAQNVATVNGKVIPAERMEQVVKQVVAQGKQPDSPQLRALIKQDLIGREVMIQQADKQGYGLRSDVKAQIENTRQSIIINALLASYIGKHPVSEAEVKVQYDAYKAQAGDQEYHARHILVATEAEAKEIIAKLKAGAKFEDLAKASKDGSAANGGDLGWASATSFVKPFSDAMVGLKNGQFTETPVPTQFGFHVIKLEESRAAKVPSFDEVKGRIAESLQQKKIVEFRESLLKKAKIQ